MAAACIATGHAASCGLHLFVVGHAWRRLPDCEIRETRARTEYGMPPNFALHAGETKTPLVHTVHGAKLRNFGACTCGYQNHLAGDRWYSRVPGAKLRNFGPHTCGHQRSPERSVGAYTCGPQSYVTLLLTRVDPNVCPTGWTLGSPGVSTKVT